MKSTAYLSYLCCALGALLIVTTACSSSRKANENDDESDDGGSESDLDGGTRHELDADTDDDDDDDDYGVPPTKGYSSDGGGSAGAVVGGSGPYKLDAGDSVRCDEDGYCYWPDGHYCDPWGMCCYPDGHCEEEPTTGGAAGIGDVIIGAAGGSIFPPFEGIPGEIPIDPDDFTDEPWDPPIDGLAEPQWRDSGKPLCTEMQRDVRSHSVWSDSRGVYVLVSGAGIGDYHYEYDESVFPDDFGPVPVDIMMPGFGRCVGEGCPRLEIYFNDGNGWDSVFREETAYEFGPGDSQLTGFDSGPLLIYGYYGMPFPVGGESDCGLATIENGVKTCEPIYYVDDVFVVNKNLAYGIYEGDVIRYNGNSWGPLPGVLSDSWINQIWADESFLVGAMEGAGRLVVLRDGTWELLDTGTLQAFYAIWGFSETDLWAGTYDGGIFHCNGESCSEISWPGDKCEYSSGIREIWGSDGVVYFYTDSTIARIVDSEVEVLVSFPCSTYEYEFQEVPVITSMWGNGPNEVFFTITDESFPRRECGVTYVVWFDGKEFHQF